MPNFKLVLTDADRQRDVIKEKLLLDHGVEPSGGVYDTLCHEEPYFRSVPQRVLNVTDSFPQAERVARRQFCLPLYPGLTREDQDYVVESLTKVMRQIR